MVRMAVPWSCWLAKDWLIAAANDGIERIPLNFFLEKYFYYEILDTEYCNQNTIPLNFLLEKMYEMIYWILNTTNRIQFL